MHKIKKGLKKKIKGKKDKDHEIFTPEELEEYKRRKLEEAQQHEVEDGENNLKKDDFLEEEPATDHLTEEAEDSEPEKKDWQKYFSATDTVLKSTSDNLEHIKESSFYQRKLIEERKEKSSSPVPPVVEQEATTKKWADLDKGIDDEIEEEEELYKDEYLFVESEKPLKEVQEVILKPIEDLPNVAAEDYADIFDTTYVDNVESGAIKLHYIPDSPTTDNPDEPDPFDTSVVDKVLHSEQAQETEEKTNQTQPIAKKKKRNLVNLGCAVDVLTGKSEALERNKSDRSLLKEVDLLKELDDSEERNQTTEKGTEDENCAEREEQNENVNCALDDLLFGDQPECELPEFIVPSQQKSDLALDNTNLVEKEDDLHNLKQEQTTENRPDLSEFLDPLFSKNEETNHPEAPSGDFALKELVQEFEVNNTNAVKKSFKPLSLALDDNIEDEFDAEFAVLAAVSLAKDKDKEIEELGLDNEDDPFDTTAASEVLGTNAALEEKEEERDPFDVEFVNEVVKTNKEVKTPARPPPPRPEVPRIKDFLDESDPFDTSAADQVLPIDHFEVIDDDITLPDSLCPNAVNKSELEDFDPFDTSVADGLGKCELKVLENELLSDLVKDKSGTPDSGFEFNPREFEEEKPISLIETKYIHCLLTGNTEEESDENVLTPQVASSELEEVDPFDTSIADKIHIKGLEDELINKEDTDKGSSIKSFSSKSITVLPEDPFDTSAADHLVSNNINSNNTNENIETEGVEDSRENKLHLKLKPPRPASPACLLGSTPTDENPTLLPSSAASYTTRNRSEIEEEIDPFDTSIADQFGVTELRALESELLANNEPSIEEDASFDPRAHEQACLNSLVKSPRPITPVCLLTAGTPEGEHQLPILSPLEEPANKSAEEDFDPFNTSIANKLGKTEIQSLEKELLDDIRVVKSEGESLNDKEAILPFEKESIEFKALDNQRQLAVDIDPFDTSIAEIFETKEIGALVISQQINKKELEEKEVHEDCEIQDLKVNNPDKLFEISPSVADLPILEPFRGSENLNLEDIDPFDTSIADSFGKNELKALESQLLESEKVSDDFDFDPREEEKEESKSKIPLQSFQSLLDTEEDLPEQALPILQANPVLENCEDIVDPFDTSIAENIGPSKAELNLINKEILGE